MFELFPYIGQENAAPELGCEPVDEGDENVLDGLGLGGGCGHGRRRSGMVARRRARAVHDQRRQRRFCSAPVGPRRQYGCQQRGRLLLSEPVRPLQHSARQQSASVGVVI